MAAMGRTSDKKNGIKEKLELFNGQDLTECVLELKDLPRDLGKIF